MNLNELIENRFVKNVKKDKMLILAITLIIISWSVIYLIFFYKPAYKSSAKILIKDLKSSEFVTSYRARSSFRPITVASNPLLTEIEILKSDKLKKILATNIEKKYPALLKTDKNGELKLGKIIKAKNLLTTDIIYISFEWDDPVKSREFLNDTLNIYQNLNLEMNKKIETQSRVFIDSKILEIGNKLNNIRKEIKNYKLNNMAMSIDNESAELVRQKYKFSSELEDLNAEISNTEKRIADLEDKLSLNVKEALNAVALGSSNENLLTLKKQLNDLKQEHAFESVRLAKTNPKIVALDEKIKEINFQIKEHILNTIGKQNGNVNINIYDDVRSKLVENFVNYHADLMGLKSERKTVEKAILTIEEKQRNLPEKAYILSKMLQEEKNYSLAYDRLRVKQIEAKLKEAEVVSNATIIEPPSLPLNKSFPSEKHILFLAMVLGGTLGVSASLFKTVVGDTCEDVQDIAQITQSSILGVIPWIKNTRESSNSMTEFAFKNLMSNFLVKSYKKKASVITFTSTYPKRNCKKSLYNLALNLKKLGHSVVIVDTDISAPGLYKNIKLAKNNPDLSEIIIKTEEKLRHNTDINNYDLIKLLSETEDNIYLMSNQNPVESSFEYFGTTSFEKIINTLKDSFDWVLIDTASANIAPEFSIISKYSDAIVLFINYKVTYSILKRIAKIIKTTEICFLGTIVREENSVLEVDYEQSKDRMENAV